MTGVSAVDDEGFGPAVPRAAAKGSHKLASLTRMKAGAPVTSVAYSPDGKTVVLGGEKDVVRLWEVATGKDRLKLAGHKGRVWAVALTPDGKTVATGGEDGVICLWDALNGKRLHTLNGHFDEVRSLAFSPDGLTLVSGSQDKRVRLWDVAAGKEVKELQGHRSWVQAVAFSPDGKTVLSGSRDETTRLWDVATGKEVHVMPSTDSQVWSVAYSPDGKTLASGGGDHQVHLWDAATGKEKRKLSGHADRVWALAFSDDGKILASGGEDKHLHLWELASGNSISQQPFSRAVLAVAFAPQGHTLTTGGEEGVAEVWDLTGRGRVDKLNPKPLTDKELQDLWSTLASGNAGQAYRSCWKLTEAGAQAVPYLQERLKPVPEVAEERIVQMVADLDSDKFAIRQKAAQDLDALGEVAAPALRAALEKKPSLDVSRRIQDLLKPIESLTPSPERLRALRALQALEHVGTAESRLLLENLAKGARSATVTQEAQASLQRMEKRAATP